MNNELHFLTFITGIFIELLKSHRHSTIDKLKKIKNAYKKNSQNKIPSFGF